MAGRGTDILLEPDLDRRIARRCAEEVSRLLTGESAGVGAVDISCPSSEQAAALQMELATWDSLAIEREPDGSTLSVLLTDGPGGRTQRAGMRVALGLCVIGTEVHDSSRITLQLNGRSGRQGHFGLAQTFLSLEDHLVNQDADAFLKLLHCQTRDAAGRPCFAGVDVSRCIRQLQDSADREGESQRALVQDYAAELDRQTHLYHRRRRGSDGHVRGLRWCV